MLPQKGILYHRSGSGPEVNGITEGFEIFVTLEVNGHALWHLFGSDDQTPQKRCPPWNRTITFTNELSPEKTIEKAVKLYFAELKRIDPNQTTI